MCSLRRLLAFVLPLLPPLQSVASSRSMPAVDGGATCSTGLDCQLNGVCSSDHLCVCDAAWGGSNCSMLKLVSPPGFTPSGFHSLKSNWSAWGGGAVYDPKQNKWQAVFHELSGRCGMKTWGANGQTRMAYAEKPAGPYTVTQLLLPPSATNPSIGRDASTGTILVTHIGTGNSSGPACFACPKLDGITPPNRKQDALCSDNPRGSHETPLFNSPLGASGPLGTTDFENGPWTSESSMPNGPNGAIFGGRAVAGHPEYEGALFYNVGSGSKINNTRCHNQNAFVRMQMAANLSAAKAGVWAEMPITYELAGASSDVPVDDICFNWEDNHVYQNARGEFHGFWHAWRGQPTDYPRPSADLYPEYGGCSTNCSD
eukprot:COSAG05_NODE_4551_length_1467_cov_1.287281_1_plen_372_part_00